MRKFRWATSAALALVVAASAFVYAQEALVIWPHTRPHFMQIAEEFAEAHPEYAVEIQASGAHDNDKLGAAMAAGIGPDVSTSVRINRYFGGWVAPLNDYFETSETLQQYLAGDTLGARILQAAAEAYSFKGEITSLATAWSYPVWGLYQNREMFEAAGLAVFPSDIAPTWDQVLEAHLKLTRIDGSGQLTQLGFPAHHEQLSPDVLAESFGIPLVAPDGGPEFEGVIQGFNYIYENFIRSIGYETILGYMPKAGDETPVTSRLAAMAVAPARGQGDLGNLDLALSYAPHVHGERVSYVAGMFWQLNYPVRNREAAYKFLDFTLTNMDWHEASLLAEGRMGAPGFDNIAWLLPELEQVNPVGAWFLRSMAEADRLTFLPLTVPWEADFKRLLGDDTGKLVDMLSGVAPVRATVEEIEEIVRAIYEASPWSD